MDKKNTKVFIVGIAALLVIFLFFSVIATNLISHNNYTHSAKIIDSVIEINPNNEKQIMMNIKNSGEEEVLLGTEILNRYGYNKNNFLNDYSFNSTVMTLFLLIIAVFLFIFILVYRQNRKKIDELTNYLSAINSGKESMLPKSSEDSFSLLQDEIYKTVVELKQSKERAVTANKALSKNLADISHQLKTPITSMSLMNELLSENNENKVYTQKLQNQIKRLEYLVTSLLTLSKIDAGTLLLKKEKIDVYTLLLGAIEPIEDVIKQKNQTIEIKSDKEVIYIGDKNQSREAILNILNNCSEHTPANGKITLSYEQNSIYTQIIIEDNGEGFAKDDIPYLFKRFYKGKNSGNDSIGIGLALSKSIIEKQNGFITAENKKTGGVRFIIKFYSN